MWPYILCFIITAFFALKNEKSLKNYDAKKDSVLIVWLTGAMTIIVPAILAGCRDYRIGTDVQVYALKCFEQVQYAHNFLDLFKPDSIYQEYPIEIGYYILAYISSIFSNDPHIFLFFITLFIGLFVYLTLYRMRNLCSIFMGQIVYLFCCYNETLNMMRQCMAMVMILYGITFLLENKSYLKCCVVLVLSYFFHHSALIGLSLLIPIYVLTRKDILFEDKKQMKWVLIISVFFSFIMANFFSLAGAFISTNDFFSEKYDHYLTDTQNTGYSGIRMVLYYLVIYAFLYFDRTKNKYSYIFLTFAVLDLMFYFLKLKQAYLYRIADYFFYCRIIGLSLIPIYSLRNVQRYKIVNTFKIIMLFLFWLLYYGGENYIINPSSNIGGAHETMPYVSDILNM